MSPGPQCLGPQCHRDLNVAWTSMSWTSMSGTSMSPGPQCLGTSMSFLGLGPQCLDLNVRGPQCHSTIKTCTSIIQMSAQIV